MTLAVRRFAFAILMMLTPSARAAPPWVPKAPPGVQVERFASGLSGARSMALGPGGVLYVGTREDRVYALRIAPAPDGSPQAEGHVVFASGLNMPNGVAVRGDDLYVAEVGRVLVFRDAGARLGRAVEPEVVTDAYPEDRAHGWKFIAFGPDGKLYVPVGAPCNICDPKEPIYASITRIDPDGKNLEIVARGVRNSVGFDWHPVTKQLWFTENGRDWLGDDAPPCELNRVTAAGQHFGYPYCHGGDIPDPEYGKKRACAELRPPALRLGAHVAPLGMRFYAGEALPESYRGGIFVAEHGSWNRSRKSGYRVMHARLDAEGRVVSYEPFLTGFVDEASQKVSGRPVDVLVLPDGSLLVSDDAAGALYRVTAAAGAT